MFAALGRRLRELQAAPESPLRADLAAAVLLLEVARADAAHSTDEIASLRGALERDFGLQAAALDALVHDAGVTADRAVSLYEFVEAVNRDRTPAQKRALLHRLWQVALADGRLDPHEEALLRKLTDLLHLEHADYIAAKLAAAAAQAPSDSAR